MHKGENMNSYLTRIHNVCDDIRVVEEKIEDKELEGVSLNGFMKEWRTFFQGITWRYQLPDWEHLWSDFTEEELRLSLVKRTINNRTRGPKYEKDEEANVDLASKGKVNKGHSEGKNSKGGEKEKKDLSKFKWFRCGDFCHYVTQYPKRKKDKKGQVHTKYSIEID